MTLNRRSFLKGAAFVGAAAVGATLPATAVAETAEEDTASTEGLKDYQRPEPNSHQRPSPVHTGRTGPDATPIPPEAEPSSWDEEHDVVIVGSGYGGLSAAIILADQGRDVVLVEKDDVTGGASRHATYNSVRVGGTEAQEAMGYHWPGDAYDPEEAAEYYEELYSYSIDQNLLVATLKGNTEWAEWMSAQPGVDWVCQGDSFVDAQIADGTYNTVLGNTRIVDALTDNAEDAGVSIKLLTQCDALVRNADGRIVGIKVSDVNGNSSYLRANSAVLLTAGGLGMNLDLLEKYIPSAYFHAAQGGPMPSHTGECFRMGIGAGADVSGFNSFGVWENGLDEYYGNGDGQWFHFFFNGGMQTIQGAWFRLDKNCDRLPFFTLSGADGGEQEGMRDLMKTFLQNGDLTNSVAWGASLDHRSYGFFDSNFREYMDKMQPTYARFDPHRYPVDPAHTRPQSFFKTDWEVEFQELVDRGAVSKADTIEELAGMLELDPRKLVAAVDHWNDICAQGKDTELLVPYRPEWLNPIDTPPYYGWAHGFRVCKTLAGLRVNPKMQVLKEDGSVIPGLYAGWHTAGGISGEGTYGCQGTNGSVLGGCTISGVGGYLAANAIVADEA